MLKQTNKGIIQTIVIPFVTYLFLFVGMGLVAGSVVHFGETDQIPRFLAIGILGMVIFVVGSYIQESLLNTNNLQKEGAVKYVLYSLLLAIGIGMISGGTQHFLDFPTYASYLLPVGFLLALIAYVLRNNLNLTRKGWSVLLIGALLIALPTFAGLHLYAKALPSGQGHGHGESQSASVSTESAPANHSTSHNMTVASDEDFILGMIPHHQEAVDTSAYLLTRTTDAELQQFLRGVIAVQSQEIDQMKQWYRQWFGRDYQDNGQYVPMMDDLTVLQGSALERAYLKGMIAHHQGAIAMAEQIQTIAQRSELKQMSSDIIRTQTQEVNQLQTWLNTKFENGDRPTSGTTLHQEHEQNPEHSH